jgi:glycerol-3-phosphate dehydrogenase subunit B
MGVRIEAGMDVINAHANDDHIEWVESETSARPLKHRARQFVLATGGILGGGFDSNMDGCVWETVFDLPLAIPQKRNEWFHASFLNPAGHPVFHGGVAVNDQFQPIKADKTPVFDNVWAVGSTLAYCDPIQERSLEGISIVTGMVAGQAITNQK